MLKLHEYRDQMNIPEGSLVLRVSFENDIFDKNNFSNVVLLEEIIGGSYFRVERLSGPVIKFYYSSPGLGTKMCVTDLSGCPSSLKVFFSLIWSTTRISLAVGPLDVKITNLYRSVEHTSDRDYRVTETGELVVVQHDTEIMGLRIYVDDKILLDVPAIESWRETLSAVETLLCSNSENKYMLEVVKANFAVVAIVTGIEVYCKKRIKELDLGGVKLNYEELLNKTGLQKEKILSLDSNYFQALDNMRKIWKHLANINVSELDSKIWLEFNRELFPYRHSVIHSHSLRDVINERSEKPLFIKDEIYRFKTSAVKFISLLHQESLKLK